MSQPPRPAPAQPGPHAHPHPHPHPHPQAPPQQMVAPPPDPAMQVIIEQDFSVVDLAIGGPNNSFAFCEPHKLEKCTDCDIDFVSVNRLSKILLGSPNLRCPPPANVVSQKLSQAITNTKDEGNNMYKTGKHRDAISRYTMAASIAVQRPPWELSQIMREELSTVISNRSAALFELGDYIGALVDAETVISIRRNWSKGHFRKAKALVGLGQLDEAKDAVTLGLQFEPNNNELNGYLADLKALMQKRAEALSEKLETPVVDSVSTE